MTFTRSPLVHALWGFNGFWYVNRCVLTSQRDFTESKSMCSLMLQAHADALYELQESQRLTAVTDTTHGRLSGHVCYLRVIFHMMWFNIIIHELYLHSAHIQEECLIWFKSNKILILIMITFKLTEHTVR